MGFETAQLYARALFPLGHGYPLFCPEPNEVLHPEYIENGIRFGDVGLITADGSFDFLFNICLPADHVINQSCGTPDDFTPVTWNRQIRRNSNFFQPGKPVYSLRAKCREISVEAMATIPGSPVGVGASIEISFDKESGAALMLPTGAKRENMLDLKAFREYAQANAVSWYYFVNNTLGRDAENGSIYLVTGVDKSDAWENAVFDSSQSSQSCSLLFESVGIGSGRMKLSQSSVYQSSVTSRASVASAQDNQALFIRGFRISLRSGLSVRILGEVKVASTDKSPMKDIFSPAPRFGQSGYSFSMTWGGSSSSSSRSGSPGTDAASSSDGPRSDDSTTASDSDRDSDSSGGSSCSDTTSINEDDYFPPSQPYHPLISINNDILQNNPKIDVVVTHDDDWISLLAAKDTVMPDDQTLTRRFRERYRVLESNGFAVLEPPVEVPDKGASAKQDAQASMTISVPKSPVGGTGSSVYDTSEYDNPAANLLSLFDDADYLSSHDSAQWSFMNIHQSYGDCSPDSSSISPNHLGIQQKGQSHPRLLMRFPNPPPPRETINGGGDSENGGSGPSVRLVPAALNGGGGAMTNSGFGLPLGSGSSLAPGSDSGDNQPKRHYPLLFPSQSIDYQPSPPHQVISPSLQPGYSPKPSQTFLFPQGNPRQNCSKSDGVLGSRTWDTSGLLALMGYSVIADGTPTIGCVNVSPSSLPSRRPSDLGNMNHFTFPNDTTTGRNEVVSADNFALHPSRSKCSRFTLPVPGASPELGMRPSNWSFGSSGTSGVDSDNEGPGLSPSNLNSCQGRVESRAVQEASASCRKKKGSLSKTRQS